MKKIALGGTIIVDCIKKIDAWPEIGNLVNIQDVKLAVGGLVCNTGIDIKRLGNIEVAAYGRICNDQYGKLALDFMKNEGLDCSHVKYVEDPTSYTDVMTLPNGQRTFFQNRGANKGFGESDIDFDNLDCDIFHLGYLLLQDELDSSDEVYGTKAARILHRLQERGIKTCIDMVSDQSGKFEKVVPPSIKYCNYVVINEIEGGKLTGIAPRDENKKINLKNMEIICKKILEMGVKDCVTLHCPELSCYMDSTGKFEYLTSIDVKKKEIVGTVGAGDAFCAGMLYGFANGMNPMDCMRLASCCSACNLLVLDSVSGATTYEKTIAVEAIRGRETLE